MIAVVGPEREHETDAETAALDGRDATLSALHREHFSELVGLARLLLDERGLAEEVVQEAFARTYEGWARLRCHDDPLPYVRGTVLNLARGGLRGRVARRTVGLPLAPDLPSPERGVLVDEERTEMFTAIRALPRRQRECIVLRYYDDLKVPQIAAALGISDGSVKQHLHRAERALAVQLTDDGGAPE